MSSGPITKIAAGGWSQRRYQQRAENTWEDNARDVAGACSAMRDATYWDGNGGIVLFDGINSTVITQVNVPAIGANVMTLRPRD